MPRRRAMGRRKGELPLELYRLVVDQTTDYAVFVLDIEGRILSWNVGAERIKGYRRDEIIGKNFSRFYTEEDIAENKPWEELATAKRVGRVEQEGWRVTKTGGRFWARVVVTPLYDSQGGLRGFAKGTQDLTTQRHVRDLELSARHGNEFIAVLAPELRNPLAPIRNPRQLMAH